MESFSPEISIVVPVFNRENLIIETIDSVVNQTFENWELILVDDGSTDNTLSEIQKYGDRDARIKVIERHRGPKGASACRNIGVDNALGEYVMFLDSDDLLTSNCLEHRMSFVYSKNQYDGWIFQTGVFDIRIGDKKVLWNNILNEKPDLIRFFQIDMPWSIMGPVWRKNQLLKFNEEALSFQDWEFHIRMLINGITYVKDTGGLVEAYYRRDQKNSSISKTGVSKKYVMSKIMLMFDLFESIQNLEEEFRFEYSKLLFRNTKELIKHAELKLAKTQWFAVKELKVMSNLELNLWWLYIKFDSKFMEFLGYRVFKKARFLNKESTFLNYFG
ncbi:Glycosyltransferase involved in cell wall bisynthesis [Lishizhenia tianjinensis]|uniref:Glycosyltransferase involved in cell wall bisynthesis n=1 Tax=Lishizhenia tianjinensis TaxID=477690 RepID=A0A1I6ZUY1_9FLAO|nr:glycosyltransferase family 2 protein [Lishizhenia tianjinensis]SFT66463.1 Glycosyltransferase involved in cell wall bisynthesis [Lishizhenia tianjinensis]